MKKQVKYAIPSFIACVIAGIFLLPIIYTVINSLTSPHLRNTAFTMRNRLITIPNPIVLDQYYWLLIHETTFLHYYWNSITLTLAICFLNIGFSFGVAYVLAKVRFAGRAIILMLYVGMTLMPLQVTLMPNFILAKSFGLFDTWWALVLPGAFSPLSVLLLRQFILAVPDELCEYARLETKQIGQVLSHVVLPLARPGIVALFVLCYAENWNMVEQPLILLADTWKYPLSAILGSFVQTHSNMSFAAGVVYLIPVMLLVMLFSDNILKGLEVVG